MHRQIRAMTAYLSLTLSPLDVARTRGDLSVPVQTAITVANRQETIAMSQLSG